MDSSLRDDRFPVSHLRFVCVQILERLVVPEEVLDVEAFQIRRPSLVDPHVRNVGGRHGIPEPLVAALVDDDEVELQAREPAGLRGRRTPSVLPPSPLGARRIPSGLPPTPR